MNTRSKIMLALLIIVILFLQLGCKPIPYYLQMVYKVHGTVVDSVTEEPIESVEVFISGYQYSDLTNGLGDYELDLAEGTWDIEFVKEGYESQIFAVTCNDDEKRVELNVWLVSEVPPGPSGENIIYGTVYLDQWMIDAGMDPIISQSSPLMVTALSETDMSYMVTNIYPTDDMEYGFPFAYEIDFMGNHELNMMMSMYDADNDMMVSSGDLVGFQWETGFLEEGGTLEVNITLTDQVADGTILVGLTDVPTETAGLAAYVTVVDPYTGNPDDPPTWLGAGEFVISDDPAADNSAYALESDPGSPNFGDVKVFPGGIYSINLTIDVAGNGAPSDPTDLTASFGMEILFGDKEVWFGSELFEGF